MIRGPKLALRRPTMILETRMKVRSPSILIAIVSLALL